MKILFAATLVAALLMLFSRLFDGLGARHTLDLDGLATLELPTAFHLATSPEQALPVARRLLRRPYVDLKAFPDRLTYYLPAHDRQTMGGEVVPIVLRVTLYADDAPLPDAPDSTYFEHLVAENFHYDGQKSASYHRATKVAEHLYYSADEETVTGWLSAKARPMHQLILTDPVNHARLFLSTLDDELPRAKAEQVLRDAQRSLRRDPAAVARYFAHAGPVVRQREAVEQANVKTNLAHFNQQLAAAGLPPLQPVARYAPGRFVDARPYFYGLSGSQEIFFAAYLGSAPSARSAEPPYFSNVNGQGRYLPSFQHQAIWQRGVPAGHELLMRSSVSLPLWYPPEEAGRFQLADLLRETTESQARVQRLPGFAPTAAQAPVRWELSAANEENLTELDAAADYRHHRLLFGPVAGPRFQLSYLGLRTATGELPQMVFTLEIFPDGSPRYRSVAADAQYLAVDATKGRAMAFAVAGHHYRARVEPPTRGHLTVTAE